MTTTLEEWQQRLLFEKIELDTKILNLMGFMETLGFHELPEVEREDLQAQAIVMRHYSSILADRIERMRGNI